VERLLRMEDLWKKRAPPTPIRLSELELPEAATLADVEQRAWTVAECAAVLVDSTVRILEGRSAEVGALKFDKDDADALDFVTAASNLRSTCFAIPRQSRWDAKEIAGKIIPAIATTNAIIAGFIVLEATKILSGRPETCRYCVCNRLLAGKKRDLLLQGSTLDLPRSECYVCGQAALTLTLDTSVFTVASLIEQVVKKHLSFNRPTIDVSSFGNKRTDQLCEGVADDVDEDEAAKYARYLPRTLADLPVPVVSGATLSVEDMSQDLSVKIFVRHEVLDPEEAPSGFKLSGSAEPAAGAPPASESTTGAKRQLDASGVDGSADGAGETPAKRARAAPSDATKAAAEPVVDDDDDDLIILD